MKFTAGELFIVNAEQSNVRLSTAIYGNVLNSTGSIIPLIWDAITKKYKLKLYSTEMTRFMVHVEEAIDLIEYGLQISGYNVIPNVKAFRISDLFEIYKDKFGLEYELGVPRISEKIHEMMFSEEESSRVQIKDGNFIMHYKNINNSELPFSNFTSDKVVITKEELSILLKKYEYFNIRA
jgi:UDP-glucose 4-epimerase